MALLLFFLCRVTTGNMGVRSTFYMGGKGCTHNVCWKYVKCRPDPYFLLAFKEIKTFIERGNY